MNPQVVLLPRRAKPFYGRHPWVFPGAVAQVNGSPIDGAEVDLIAHGGGFVARGFYNSRSKIRVRLYEWNDERPLDRSFFRERLAAAIRLRTLLQLEGPGTAFRLVFSEGDGLSGLIVDRYDRWLVTQFTSLALAQRRNMFAELLAELTGVQGIYLRTERGIGRLEGLELQDGLLWGTVPTDPVVIAENGLQFQANLSEGQKTGFYIDQRDNRLAAAKFASGRNVLDAFCYTGGFGLQAARHGAAEVLGVDQSESALEIARRNAQLNGLDDKVQFRQGDVFESLEALETDGRKFGMIVLDPPKFARSRTAIDEAIRGYRRLQSLAMRLLEPDGILVSCCCTGLITMEMLLDLLAQVCADAKRDAQILERRGASTDHPVAVACLESNYLKCLIVRVR